MASPSASAGTRWTSRTSSRSASARRSTVRRLPVRRPPLPGRQGGEQLTPRRARRLPGPDYLVSPHRRELLPVTAALRWRRHDDPEFLEP